MSSRLILFSLLALAHATALPGAAAAQERVDVTFTPGNFGTMLSGEIIGDAYMDFLLGAAADQEMFVALDVAESSGSGTIYFNILPPGSDGVAIYNSSVEGNVVTQALDATGPYAIRVYQMGNDRDAGATTSFNLDVSIQ